MTPPALTVLDLFVGQDSAAIVTPVQQPSLAVGEPSLQHLEKNGLLPAVVIRIASRELALPINRQAKLLELSSHCLDVASRPVRRMSAILASSIFGREPKSVPTHRVEYVVASSTLEASDNVADGIVAHMPHVQSPARVGEHLQDVVLGPIRCLRDRECALLCPALLPLLLNRLGGIGGLVFGHGRQLASC